MDYKVGDFCKVKTFTSRSRREGLYNGEVIIPNNEVCVILDIEVSNQGYTTHFKIKSMKTGKEIRVTPDQLYGNRERMKILSRNYKIDKLLNI